MGIQANLSFKKGTPITIFARIWMPLVTLVLRAVCIITNFVRMFISTLGSILAEASVVKKHIYIFDVQAF